MFFLKIGFKRSLGLFHSFMPDIDHTTSNALIALFCPRIDLMLMMTRTILAIDEAYTKTQQFSDKVKCSSSYNHGNIGTRLRGV